MKLEDNIIKMEEQIDKLKSEIASMKAQLKQEEKLELKGGEGWFIQTHYDPVGKEHLKDNSIGVIRGAFRATKELAEIADKNMVARNRLEAYVHQIQGDVEGKYSINVSNNKYMWACSLDNAIKIGAVMMQKETAEILCEKLNAEEIEL